MILDFDQGGDVLGVEIINLALKTGKNSLGVLSHCLPTKGEGLKYSYDKAADAFYLRLSSGRSLAQKSVKGTLLLDAGGQMLGLTAEWA
jgi:uncharacterized protein YuzE